MGLFVRIVTAPVLQKGYIFTCSTKRTSVLIEKKNKFPTYVFINESVDPDVKANLRLLE